MIKKVATICFKLYEEETDCDRQTDRQIVCDKQTYEKDKESQTKRQRQKKLNGFQVRAQKG